MTNYILSGKHDILNKYWNPYDFVEVKQERVENMYSYYNLLTDINISRWIRYEINVFWYSLLRI